MTPHLVIFGVYAALTLLVGVWSRRRSPMSQDFLQASRSLRTPVVLVAYLAANCGALEVVGLSAMAAEYGAVTLHFYWIGAIPALVFLALWMMPLYRLHDIQSVPQFLRWRYGARMQMLNAGVTAIVLQLLAGISLYAMGSVVHVIAGISFPWSVLVCASIVTLYVQLGGLRATMYNQVLQFVTLLAGVFPLAVRCLRRTQWAGSAATEAHAHVWRGLPWVDPRAPMDVLGVVMGLGCVLSFSYWCTDFVLMQRAFTARSDFAARQIPLWAGFGKLLFAIVVVVPGLAAPKLLSATDGRFDLTMPRLMQHLYGPWMLALGSLALCAGLMSTFAGNLTALAAVCTGDLLPMLAADRSALRTRTGPRGLGFWLILLAAALSLLLSYLNFLFGNVMEHVQLIFSVLGVPFWAVFVGGMVARGPSERSAFAGFSAGAVVALSVVVLARMQVLHFGSNMASDFYAAFAGFAAALLFVLGLPAGATPHAFQGPLLLRFSTQRMQPRQRRVLLLLAASLLLCTGLCNWIFR